MKILNKNTTKIVLLCFALLQSSFLSLSGTFKSELSPKGIYGHPFIRYVKIIPCCIGHAICCTFAASSRPPALPSSYIPFRFAHSTRRNTLVSRFFIVGDRPSSIPEHLEIFEKRFAKPIGEYLIMR